MTQNESLTAIKTIVAAKAGNGYTDRLAKNARLAERERCGQMLNEFIAQGRTSDEIVRYAQSLLLTDY